MIDLPILTDEDVALSDDLAPRDLGVESMQVRDTLRAASPMISTPRSTARISITLSRKAGRSELATIVSTSLAAWRMSHR